MSVEIQFRLPSDTVLTIRIERAIIASWTGRDRAAVDYHIAELAELGVAPPSEVPLTHEPVIEAIGATSSGEVEPLLMDDGAALYLGLGSDHADRAIEAHSVALSKQMCPKPLARALWRYDELRDHLDEIGLRSWVWDDQGADWVPYQDGTLADIQPLADLVARSPTARGGGRLEAGTLMMCGMLSAKGGVRPARFFRMEISDPVLGRSIAHAYEAVFLPVVT